MAYGDFHEINPSGEGVFDLDRGNKDSPLERELVNFSIKRLEQDISVIQSKHRQGNKSSQKVRINAEIKGLWKQVTQNLNFGELSPQLKITLIGLFQEHLGDDSFAQSYFNDHEKFQKKVANIMN